MMIEKILFCTIFYFPRHCSLVQYLFNFEGGAFKNTAGIFADFSTAFAKIFVSEKLCAHKKTTKLATMKLVLNFSILKHSP